MKQFFSSLFLFITLSVQVCYSQSNPVVLKPGIAINRILTVQDGSIRVIKDPVSKNLFYSTTDGRIYEVHQPAAAVAYDSLVFTAADHHVTYAQGFTVYDSTFYISGNDSSNTPLTFGIIARGKLQPNGTRVWSTVMQTDFYKTADYFDHLFSGIAVTPSGDSIVICSGARGDHGEVETRYGLYPNLRNVPLTTNLYIVPAHDPGVVVLHNDSAWHDTTVNLFARGIRNTFDMAFDSQGRLFGVENSGDRDHNEEMNWLRRGHHYGFPWRMGDTDNPQRFASFNPATDPLISHYSRSWRIGAWSNDPTYPPPPAGVVFDAPIQNFGPDADKYRDTITGTVLDASDGGVSMGTFTAHRSPLGLVFDNDSVMHPDYRGDAFMLSWTKGLDSCGCTAIPDTAIGPFVDPSQDLIHLDLAYDSLLGNFYLHATRIISDFQNPVDDAIDSNKIYVLENGYGGTSGLFEVVMPYIPPCAPNYSVAVAYIACDSATASASTNATGYPPYIYEWRDSTGNAVQTDTLSAGTDSISSLLPGNYSVQVTDSFGCAMNLTFSIAAPLQVNIEAVNSCDSVGAYSIAHASGSAPFTYEWRATDSTGAIIQSVSTSSTTDTLLSLLPGTYFVKVTDSIGCMDAGSFIIIQPIQLSIDSLHHTTCAGCNNGVVYFTTAPGAATPVLNPPAGTLLGNSISGLPAGSYTICVTDSFACTACDTFDILEDPLSAASVIGGDNITVYPNPANAYINIQFRSLNSSKVSVTLYDVIGKKIEAETFEKELVNGKKEISLYAGELENGYYLIEVKAGNNKVLKKISVLRN